MSNLTLSIIILVGFMFILAVITIIFLFARHAQYMREATNKLKMYILPETGAMEIKIVNVDFSKNWVANPDKDGNLPRYYFNKENLWSSRYPNDPFLGLTWLCVPIGSGIWRKNNPEPVTSHPIEPLVTAESIGAAIDEEFELVLKKISSTMLKLEKQLTEALAGHLNKMFVYGVLIVLVLLVCISLYASFSAMSSAGDVAKGLGLK